MKEETLRLSKLMAHRNLCSRREADSYIEKGQVLVNGQVVSELGTKVSATVSIELKSSAQKKQQQRLTILLNKPVGVVSCQPEKGYKAAIELISPSNRDPKFKTKFNLPSYLPKIAVAGRLDINSKGLLILTQDGRIAKQLIQEDSEIEKEYLVRVHENASENQLSLLRHGIKLDGKMLKPALIDSIEANYLRFTLKQGRKRQIRRMCETVNLKVTSIKRVRIGNIRLGSLKEGQWRFLEANESF